MRGVIPWQPMKRQRWNERYATDAATWPDEPCPVVVEAAVAVAAVVRAPAQLLRRPAAPPVLTPPLSPLVLWTWLAAPAHAPDRADATLHLTPHLIEALEDLQEFLFVEEIDQSRLNEVPC